MKPSDFRPWKKRAHSVSLNSYLTKKKRSIPGMKHIPENPAFNSFLTQLQEFYSTRNALPKNFNSKRSLDSSHDEAPGHIHNDGHYHFDSYNHHHHEEQKREHWEKSIESLRHQPLGKNKRAIKRPFHAMSSDKFTKKSRIPKHNLQKRDLFHARNLVSAEPTTRNLQFDPFKESEHKRSTVSYYYVKPMKSHLKKNLSIDPSIMPRSTVKMLKQMGIVGENYPIKRSRSKSVSAKSPIILVIGDKMDATNLDKIRINKKSSNPKIISLSSLLNKRSTGNDLRAVLNPLAIIEQALDAVQLDSNVDNNQAKIIKRGASFSSHKSRIFKPWQQPSEALMDFPGFNSGKVKVIPLNNVLDLKKRNADGVLPLSLLQTNMAKPTVSIQTRGLTAKIPATLASSDARLNNLGSMAMAAQADIGAGPLNNLTQDEELMALVLISTDLLDRKSQADSNQPAYVDHTVMEI